MNILVTGALGMLGRDVCEELCRKGHRVTGTYRPERLEEARMLHDLVPYLPLDITDREAVRKVIFTVQPEAIIHCAAWTAVNAAELPQNRDDVYAVNALGTEYLAEACGAIQSTIIYVSTDYVFDGLGKTPWDPDRDVPRALSVYGHSKLMGEEAVRRFAPRHFIVRTSWLFGKHGQNFVSTMLGLGSRLSSIQVVNDQIGTPTYTIDLARLLADMSVSRNFGTYHGVNSGGYISWYDFAKEIFRCRNLAVELLPVDTATYCRGDPTPEFPVRYLQVGFCRLCALALLAGWASPISG